jgi:putative two-component system response regulator
VALEAGGLEKARILIVDDQEDNVELLALILERAGYTNVTKTTRSSKAIGLCLQTAPDLVLLDLRMPAPDGLEVLRRLKPWLHDRWLPVIVLTADGSATAKREALSLGARDFVTKPLDRTEVLIRTRNLLEVRFLQIELREQSRVLERSVRERTQDLDESRFEMLERLARAAEYRDDATGEHTRRVGRTAALIARAMEEPDRVVELIEQAAPLHDVGKIGIPDEILLKPRKLVAEEFDVIKTHVTIGGSILSHSRSPLLQMAEEIAFTHHERWDGHGYVSGMRSVQIPLPGRIVAVADVFDALTHERPYKDAMPVPEAVEEICGLAGRQFDPAAVEAFETLDHESLVAVVDAKPVGGGAGDGSRRSRFAHSSGA